MGDQSGDEIEQIVGGMLEEKHGAITNFQAYRLRRNEKDGIVIHSFSAITKSGRTLKGTSILHKHGEPPIVTYAGNPESWTVHTPIQAP